MSRHDNQTMEYRNINSMEISLMSIGCMRIADKSVSEVDALVRTALDCGINYFDHADIYGQGKSEEVFGEVMKNDPSLRNRMLIQSKCGIVPGCRYDFSKEHILESVDNSLRKLNTDHLDVLLLHRPDALADYQEVAQAFDQLQQEGKVLNFGVSNFSESQMKLMSRYVKTPLLFNQLQFSIVHCPSIDEGFHVNMKDDLAANKALAAFDYCTLNGITIQAWSVIQASWAEGCFIDHPSYQNLNNKLQELADKYGVTKAAVAIAWILRHPAGIMAILGTTSPQRVKEMAKATDFTLTRQEWYDLYMSAGKNLP